MCPGDACSFKEQAARELAERLACNKKWAQSMEEKQPGFFGKLVGLQAPEVLWIGCAEARVPANELVGLRPGEVLVQRNVGNIASFKDMNLMSCLEYAVAVQNVKHIVLCGHYGCGAVEAALEPANMTGLANLWIQDIRDTRDKNIEALRHMDPKAQADKLVELNVMRQVFNVCTSPVVQQAWDYGQPLAIHGLVYSLADGRLTTLYTTESSEHQPGSFFGSSSAKASWTVPPAVSPAPAVDGGRPMSIEL